MTYFEGFIVPVPGANKDAYRTHSSQFAPLVQEIGVRRMVEGWDSDVQEGKLTDFRKAVEAKPDEKIVFSFFEYPSVADRNAANEKFRADPRMAELGSNVPFDGKRMIMGGFEAIVEEGTAGGRYIDGIIVPVPVAKRDEYKRLATHNAKLFREYGANRVIETLADDVEHGKVTDFFRAVKAEEGETIAFSFIEWPSKDARDQAWQKIMHESRMQHGGGLFDGKRMFWGGFEVLLDTAHETISAAQPVTA